MATHTIRKLALTGNGRATHFAVIAHARPLDVGGNVVRVDALTEDERSLSFTNLDAKQAREVAAALLSGASWLEHLARHER